MLETTMKTSKAPFVGCKQHMKSGLWKKPLHRMGPWCPKGWGGDTVIDFGWPTTGVPNPRLVDQHQSTACQKPGRANKQSPKGCGLLTYNIRIYNTISEYIMAAKVTAQTKTNNHNNEHPSPENISYGEESKGYVHRPMWLGFPGL